MSSHGTPSLAAGTVGDWTSRSFRCVVVIEKYDLDFHTEADLSLEEACRAARSAVVRLNWKRGGSANGGGEGLAPCHCAS